MTPCRCVLWCGRNGGEDREWRGRRAGGDMLTLVDLYISCMCWCYFLFIFFYWQDFAQGNHKSLSKYQFSEDFIKLIYSMISAVCFFSIISIISIIKIVLLLFSLLKKETQRTSNCRKNSLPPYGLFSVLFFFFISFIFFIFFIFLSFIFYFVFDGTMSLLCLCVILFTMCFFAYKSLIL
jgi:hypothetical protein